MNNAVIQIFPESIPFEKRKRLILGVMKDHGKPMMKYQFKGTKAIANKLSRDLDQLHADGLITACSYYGKVKYRLNT